MTATTWMTTCGRCGTEVPDWSLHTAADHSDVCAECCDVCHPNEEETSERDVYRELWGSR